jgi:hypothetical protein
VSRVGASMARITASYQITLRNKLRIERLPDDDLTYNVTLDAFDVQVSLIRNNDGAHIVNNLDGRETYLVEAVKIRVTRGPDGVRPEILISRSGVSGR